MREILFRGKRIDNDEMFRGNLLKLNKKTYLVPQNAWFEWGKLTAIVEIYPETLGQYTGLRDKNGKRIFEGDICKNTKTSEIVSVQWHGTMAGYVWNKRKENNQNLFDFGELFRAYDKYEVIGNIHDNPELLRAPQNDEVRE